MPSTGLEGPFPLTENGIKQNVTYVSPGAYALGSVDGGTFMVSYVGRSDSDIADRLKDHVGKYSRFKYGYYDSAKAAFLKECRLYHDFSPPGNTNHPARPAGSGWKCPICTVFD